MEVRKKEASRQGYGATSRALLMIEKRNILLVRRGSKGGYVRAVVSGVYIASGEEEIPLSLDQVEN